MTVNRKLSWALLSACALVAFLAFAYPLYVIRPFRGQSAQELSLALSVRSWGPGVAALAAAVALGIGVSMWHRNLRALPRVILATTALVTIAFAVLSRVNVYELMFHRIESPEFLSAKDAKLENDDMVIAINIGGHARAYPIRMMGYHHIVNDWVGDIPVVGTY